MKKYLHQLFALIFILIGIGCGGGTSGTGSSSQTYMGTITDSAGAGLANLSVTISETGDSASTNSLGQFSITSDAGLTKITLLIEGENISKTVPVDISEPDDSLAITVSIDTKDKSSDSFGADIRVKIVGTCDLYFENTRPIRQASAVRKGQLCKIRVSMRGRSGGLPNRQYALQVRGCKTEDEKWSNILHDDTGDVGVGLSEFKFEDSINKCEYRVLVPLNDNKIPVLEFPIHTFSYQRTHKD